MNTLNHQCAIQELVEQYQKDGYFPSACVKVFDKDHSLFTVCVGDATEDALFDVASLTKIATATRILLWIEDGTLSLDAPVSDLWPEIGDDKWLRERLHGITLKHLLTHTSSITPWFPFYSQAQNDFWSVFRYALQNTKYVEGMEYSDLNFMLLGILCERISGKSLKACLQDELVLPLQLGRMMYKPSQSDFIIPSSYDNQIEMELCAERNIRFDGFRPMNTPVCGTVNDGNAHYYFDDVAGHAGIFADVDAYMRLCQFYMNHASPLFAEAQKEQPGAPTRGLGLQTGDMYPCGCGHTGFTGTSIYFSSEYNIGAVAFTNRLYFTSPTGKSTNDFRKALHEKVFAMAKEVGYNG